MEYPVETFTPAEAARLAPHVTSLDGPVFGLVNLPETVKGALFARYSRYQGTLRRLFLDEFADSLPGRRRRGVRRSRGRARRAALRADLRRLRRRLGRPARRRAHRLRVGLQRPHEGPAAPAPGRLPRAVHALHRLRRADARRRLPLLPRRRTRPGSTRPRWTRSSTSTPRRCRACSAWAEGQFARADGESEAAHARACQAKALDLLRGLLPAASLSHMGIFATGQTYEQLVLHLLAHPLPEARALRPDDPRHAPAGDAELRLARRASRPRRRVDHVPGGARGGRPALGRAPGPGPRARRGPGRRAVRPAAARRRRRGRAARRAAVRGRRRAGGGHAHAPGGAVGRRAPRAAHATSWASAATAATGPAAAWRRCATASRSSATTARSATCSATACSPCSGSAWARTSARACPTSSRPPASPTSTGARSTSRAPSGSAWRATGREGEALYALCLGLPDPLRPRPQRARGDAADRAALRSRGPPELPRRRARDAPPDRAGAPGRRRPR